jgi:hypothetical protein
LTFGKPAIYQVGQGTSGLIDRCLNRNQAQQLAPKVVAAGVFRNGQREKRPGLEPPAQGLSQAGHFDSIADGLFSLVCSRTLKRQAASSDLGLHAWTSPNFLAAIANRPVTISDRIFVMA